MAKITAFLFVILLLAGALLPGCSKEEVLDVYGSAVSAAGNIGLDSSLFLKGERHFGADRYTGTYTAAYEDFTGTEHLFGGTMLEKRAQEKVLVTCTVKAETGTARLVWNCGEAAPVTLAEGEGEFTETAYLSPGSNYFNLQCDGFTGSVEMELK